MDHGVSYDTKIEVSGDIDHLGKDLRRRIKAGHGRVGTVSANCLAGIFV